MSEFKSVEQISDELITLSLVPNSRWQNLLNLDIIKVCLIVEEEFIMSEFKSVEQISDELITLSLVPNSRWQNLLNLDIIKVCHS